MKTYLVEAWDSEVEFDENSLIVALTPEVCYLLDKAGTEYSIIEDYYDEAELSALEDEYYESQMEWIKGLDEFLQSNINEVKELNLRLATIYYYYLKSIVLDPLYIRCYTLNKLFKTIKPSNVVFISYPPKETPLDFGLRYHGKSLYSQVVPILCGENNIQLTSVFVERDNRKGRELRFVGANVATRLKITLGNFEIIRKIYSIYKTFCRRPLLAKRPDGRKLKILMLKLGKGGEELVKDALRNGHDVYLLSGGFILQYSSLGVRRHLDLRAKYEGEAAGLNTDVWQSTANLLEGNDLIRWINERCQANVSEIVLPRLKYFISKVCPDILGYFKVFHEFYEDEKIDFVITPHEISLTEFAAITAASDCSHTKSVMICHGDDTFANKYINIIWLDHFNITISSNKEYAEYFKYQCEVNNIPTELYSSSHRLSNIEGVRNLRVKHKGNLKNRIVFLPTMFMGDTRRLDGTTQPDTWYYEFQKLLIEHFSRKGEYTFVWKGLPTSDAIYNPIPEFIRDNNFSNIEIATNPFVEHLLLADRVICDYPSTGFYESVVAGVPTISLYHKAFKVRRSAVEYFGNLLKLFSTIPEAIKHIDEFLNSDPELYKTTIEMGDESVLRILEKIRELREMPASRV